MRGLVGGPSIADTLYAGTGGGAFKSTDGGAHWSVANDGLTNLDVRALALARLSPDTVYAGTGGGVFKSTDGGAHWSAANQGMATLDVRALALDPLTPTTVYAGTFGQYVDGVFQYGGVYKSTDGGDSWSLGTITPSRYPATAVVVDPQTPTTLYAGTPAAKLYKSTDGGATWSSTRPVPSTDPYVRAVAIDPLTPTTLYVATGGAV